VKRPRPILLGLDLGEINVVRYIVRRRLEQLQEFYRQNPNFEPDEYMKKFGPQLEAILAKLDKPLADYDRHMAETFGARK
jgi:hypothetical protein